MRKEIKKLWVEALRSGEYKKNSGFLRSASGSFCPLGVLCDLHRKRRKTGRWRIIGAIGAYEPCGGAAGDSSANFLPSFVAKWAGLDSRDPKLGTYSVSRFNDYCGFSFKKIATLIERSKL